MKVSCPQEQLSRGLAVVRPAVASRTTLPITQNVLLATDGDRLKLAATDLEIALSCWLDATIEEEGTTTVPARLLIDFVNSLPSDRIQLHLPSRSRTLRLSCARNEATMGSMDADDFPPIPLVQSDAGIRIERSALKQAIAHVAFAAATDDSRPVLTGVHFLIDGDELTLAAADGFRLAVRIIQVAEPFAESMDIIVPARALQELARILGDQEEPVRITVTPNRSPVLFRLKDVELFSRLIEASFPNYQQIIPTSHATRVIVDTRKFQNAIRIASFFARDASNIVRLQVTAGEELTPGRVVVAATATDVGDTVAGIDSIVEGDATQIAFNAKYLSEVLGVLDTEQVSLEFSSPSRPGVFKPIGVEGYTHVIMPMHVTQK